ncbi:MAG: germination protein YpeB [Eubacteriales bacterium]|nr:germination protein YpeB [Eubacteriales bacterium]
MKRSIKITVVILAAAAVLCLGATAALALRADALNKRLSAVVSGSCTALAESISTTRTSLAKLSARGDDAELRRRIAVSAGTAAEALSHLPLGDEVLQRTMSFFNRVADWSRYASDAKDAAALYAACDTLYSELSAYLMSSPAALTERLLRGEAASPDAPEADIFTMPEADYPRLIYDGPFSDAAKAETMPVTEGLPKADEAAVREAVSALGAPDLLRYVNTEIPYWYVTGRSDGADFTAAFTAAGARLWWADFQYDADCDPTLTDEEAQAEAIRVAARMGYEGLAPVFLQHTERGVLVNLAAVTETGDDTAVCYSDLIKITLCGDGSRLVLFDAGNYLRSHRDRAVDAPKISAEQAAAALPPSAAVHGPGRLAMCPDENKFHGDDVLCYEFVYTDEATGRRCYCYVRADDGQVFDLLIVEDEAVV